MTISIETAQNVNITYKPAGLLPRIIATVIDLCLLTGIFILCCYMLEMCNLIFNFFKKLR